MRMHLPERTTCWVLVLIALGGLQGVAGGGSEAGSLSAAPTAERAASGEDKKVIQLIGKGYRALERGKHKAALRSFKRANKRAKGDSVEALLGLAKTYRQLSNYEKSAQHARAAVERARTPATQMAANNLLGLALFERTWNLRGDTTAILEEARAAFQKVLEISGGEANAARYNLAEVLTQMRRRGEALSLIEEYLEREADETLRLSAVALRDYLLCVKRLAPLKADQTGVVPPVKLSSPQPRYPDAARLARIEGRVIVEAVLDVNGSLVCPRLVKGLSHGLNEATLDTIHQWKFRPATLDGEPVAILFNLIMRFGLER